MAVDMPRSDNNLLLKYKKIISNYKIIAKVIGIDRALDIETITFNFNFVHVIDYSLVVHYVFSVIYVICTKFENKMDVLRSLSLCPIAVQCVVKLTTFFSNTKLIKELNIVNLDLCGNTTGIWQDCLYVWFHKFEQISTLHVSVHWFGATLLLCYPLYGYFVLGEMVPFFDVVIPFVDDTTARGYIVTLLFQFVLCVFVISIMYNVDYLFLLTLFSGAAFIDLVEEDCKALSFTIVNSKREVNVSGIRDRLISAIRRNQGMRRYLKKTCAIFENGCLIQLYCGGFTLCVCLFVAKMSDWFPIYFIGIAALYQMSLYCLLGTMIEWKSNQLSKVVYDVPWNKLNVNNQKVFRYFLQMSQSTIKVTLMGSLTLNIQTGMAILKTVYSLYILMDKMY